MPEELLFILIGLVAGLLAGMLGIGGGVITVPALYYLLPYSNIPPDRLMHVAVSTSLASTAVISCIASFYHHQKKSVHSHPVLLLLPGLLIGCPFGSIMAQWIPSTTLRLIFGAMAILLGVYFFFPQLPPLHIADKVNKTLAFFGLIIGTLSSLLGLGGGIFTVPVLIGYQVPVKASLGTSSTATLITALIGTVSYLIIAGHKEPIPSTFGYIELPAFLMISLGSICSTQIGVHLAHRLPVHLIKRIFGGAVVCTGIFMLFH